MADLQEAMGGLSPPSIYAAFGSKEELFKEAVELYRSKVAAPTGRALVEAPTAKEAIEGMLRGAVMAATEAGEPRGCLVVQGAITCSPSSEAVQEYLQEVRAEGLRAVTKRLKAGVAAGDLPKKADVNALAIFYTTLAHGIAIQARDGASRGSLMSAVDRAMAAWDVLVRA